MLLRRLVEIAGPLRPGEPIEERYDAELHFILDATREEFCGLLDLARRPPSEQELAVVLRQDFELMLANILGAIASRAGPDAVMAVEALLFIDAARWVAAEALGVARSPRSVRAMRETLYGAELGEQELVTIASVLGEIGGAEAIALLGEMRAFGRGERVEREIEVSMARAVAHDAYAPV
jgi:hypothetical protein